MLLAAAIAILGSVLGPVSPGNAVGTATVSGKVTVNNVDVDVAGIQVYLIAGTSPDHPNFASGVTASNGTYSISAVEADTYKVLFIGTGADTPGLNMWRTGDDVVVGAGATVTNINGNLDTFTSGALASAPNVTQDGSLARATWAPPSTPNGTILAYESRIQRGDSSFGPRLHAANSDARLFTNTVEKSAVVSVRAITPRGFGAFGFGAIRAAGSSNSNPAPEVYATSVTRNSASLTFRLPEGTQTPVRRWWILSNTTDVAAPLVAEQLDFFTNDIGGKNFTGLAAATTYSFFVRGETSGGRTLFGRLTFRTPTASTNQWTTIGTPSISGTGEVGTPHTASAGTWSPSLDSSFTYQWMRNGVDVGPLSRTYTPVTADVGAYLSVRVTGIKSGYDQSYAMARAVRVAGSTAGGGGGGGLGEFDSGVTRLQGANRYATAAAIAAEFPSPVSVVYVATGLNYPDALSAAAAAGHLNGALLLVEPNAIPSSTQAQLVRLKPTRIVIVGGTATVSASVETKLKTFAGSGGVRRDFGADRYETSRVIADRAFGRNGADTAYIATGANFADALSASAAAGSSNAPVILVPGNATTVDAATKAMLTRLGVTSVTIAGGTGAVSAGIEQSLKTQLGTGNVIRRAGVDRYSTSVALNKAAFSSSDVVFFATGLNFPDALAGGALAAVTPGPLYVVPGTCVPKAVLTEISRLGATSIVLFGGRAVLTSAVAELKQC
jgi:putative cell wall-binding protein